MATGSGLDSYLATKTETTVGTGVTGTNFWAFNSAELTYEPSYIENAGIMNGARFKDVGQVGIARKAASGKIEIPVMQKGFGWWFKHLIGSAATPAVDSGTAYKQLHVPGGLRGISFTAQIGKPNPADGVVALRSYVGCKITDWDITFADNAVTLMSCSVDAFNEDSSGTPAAPGSISYTANNAPHTFSNVTTFETVNNDALDKVTATSGAATLASGVAVPSVVTKLTLSGKSSLANERYGLGNAGLKKEQLENDFFTLTGAFEGEFDPTTWETPFVAGSTVAFHIKSQGALITTGKYCLLDIVLPACKITKAPAPVSGPDVVKVSGEFTVYNPNVGSGATLVSPIHVLYEDTTTAFA